MLLLRTATSLIVITLPVIKTSNHNTTVPSYLALERLSITHARDLLHFITFSLISLPLMLRIAFCYYLHFAILKLCLHLQTSKLR